MNQNITITLDVVINCLISNDYDYSDYEDCEAIVIKDYLNYCELIRIL